VRTSGIHSIRCLSSASLPFSILPGIVDADHFKLSVQFPFLLQAGFEGVIPAGTPVAQIIPISS
jgi:hypothetical protein